MDRLVGFVTNAAWSLPTWFVFAASVVLYRRLRGSHTLVMLVGSTVTAGISVLFAAVGRSWTGSLGALASVLNVASAYGKVLLGAGILMLALQGVASIELRARRMPTNLLLVLFCVGSTLGAAGSISSLEMADYGSPSLLRVVLSVVAAPLLLFAALAFWSRAWGSIQDGHARTSPGRAIGLLFVPLFNLYWIFQVTWGFAKDFNAFRQRHGVQQAPLPEGLFLALPVLGILSLIPFAGPVISVAGSVLYIFVIARVGNAVNALGTDDAPRPGA